MKITVKSSNRIRFYTTMITCAAALWMMVSKFHLDIATFVRLGLMTIALALGLILVAAAFAWLCRFVMNRFN